MGIFQWLDDQQKRETQQVRDRRGYRSGFYHREFEGYAEREYVDERGRRRIERIYAAEYYEPRLPRRKRIQIRFLYAALFLLSAGLYGYAGLQDAAGNYAVYVVIPVAASLVLLFLTLMALMNYLPLGLLKLPQMKKGPRRLRWAALAAAIALFCAGAASFLFLILHGADAKTVSITVCYLLSAAGMLAIHLIERRVKYDVVRNSTDIENAVILR